MQLVNHSKLRHSPIDKVTASIQTAVDDNCLMVKCIGSWNTFTVHTVDDQMRDLEKTNCDRAVIYTQNIDGLDTSGAWLLERCRFMLEKRGLKVEVQGIKESWQALFTAVGNSFKKTNSNLNVKKKSLSFRFFETIGKSIVESGSSFIVAMHILGATISGPSAKHGKKSGISIPALVTQIDRMGVGAIPIIILMSFIVGAIIAQQGAFQLRYFGAEIFVVDLVGILVFRELGVLLTAIMIAGRSGSAITAEIGSMKMREETDALTVMGLNPVAVLVFPRLVALAIILPLLTVIADISALMGACFVADVYSNIPYEAFMGRLTDAVTIQTYIAGLIKAPFMALVIGVIASVEGLKVGGSAESLGRRVTSSVVQSIFIVIVIDGLFAIFYSAINF